MDDIEVREYICFGNCEDGANTVVFPDRVWFSGLRIGDSPIVIGYLTGGACSEKHTGKVDVELAETIWEILELDAPAEAQSVG
jgi:(2Fe-2S) ferredoxin